MTVPNQKMQKNIFDFPVVAIAASSGGLEVLKKILPEISPNSGMTYIIVQHFLSDFPGNTIEILSQYTTIPVREIINDINMEPNHIYIMPENNMLITLDGVLKLKRNTRNERPNNNIDIFFESLARVYKSLLIGIILLSDSVLDGALGFKKIKESGGVTILQDPKTAGFKGIPQTLIGTYAADFVLEAESIPSELLQIQKKYTINYAYSDEENIPPKEKEIFIKIIDLIFLRTGNDFRNYKQAAIRRQLAIRMVKVQKDTLEDYYSMLQNNKKEQNLLFNDLLITATNFFRDQKSFESLTEIVFPSLFKNITNDTLRIWVAGCATGEEAYSLAICIDEYLLKTNNKTVKVRIFASDLSEKSIAKARAAVYSYQDIQHLSEERLQNYFVKSNGQYFVNKVIRDSCVFTVHNLIKDTPLAKIDLVSCRNVLKYFDSFLENKVLASFHYSLKDRGILFLGKSETLSNEDLFENMEKQEQIYVRKFFNRYVSEVFNPVQNNLLEKMQAVELNTIQKNDFEKIVSDILDSKYTPVSVIINKDLDIVYFHGDTSPFLSPSPGKPSFNILKMAKEGISSELHNAILKVKSEKINIRKDNIQLKKQSYFVSFEILALQNDDEHLMVLFYKMLLEEGSNRKLIQKNKDQKHIDELEHELSQQREDMKQILTGQQTAFEELQTINEEFKMTIQELESNKEELVWVNDELKERQKQLTSLRDYAETIIKTIHEPLLIIDKNFIIKNANPEFYKYFITTDVEIGNRIFFEIGNAQWDIPEFKEQIIKVINNNEIIENFKIDVIGAGIGKKIMMVNARRIQGSSEGLILLAFNDITNLVNAKELLMVKKMEVQMQNSQLETFTSAASHNLQEPLRKIHMYSKRILDTEKNISESAKHDLERIQQLILNMGQLINDLINYSRVNYLAKEYKKTDLNSLLKKNIRDLKNAISEKKVVITVTPFPELNVIPHQIQQLFTNLISNSIKYSKEGVTPEIKIQNQQVSNEEIIEMGGDPEIEYVKISFIDNGIGFDKGYETRIFEPFYRLHTNNYYKGSGLGLTLVKKIVANHRGFIKSISEVNLGTTMVIYIPV